MLVPDGHCIGPPMIGDYRIIEFLRPVGSKRPWPSGRIEGFKNLNHILFCISPELYYLCRRFAKDK